MSLYLASTNQKQSLKEMGYVMNIPQYTGPIRCDLHPRFSNNHSKVVCDIPSKIGRRILIIEGNYAIVFLQFKVHLYEVDLKKFSDHLKAII